MSSALPWEGGDGAPDADDAELMAAVVAGDSTAASAFHRRVWPVVLKTVRRLLRYAHAERDDIAMDAVEQLVLSADSYQRHVGLERWVSRVTAHVAYNHLRRKRLEARLFVSSDDEGDDSLSEPLSPIELDRELEIGRALARVRGHLAKLGDDKATCFVLHDVHGYTLAEIAGILRISEAAAQTRLSRGRRELHDRIERDSSLGPMLATLRGRA